MKSILFSIMIFLLGAAMLSSCEKEYFPPAKVDSTQPVSFSKVILPIFQSDCAQKACHGGAVAPDLTAEGAYNTLTDGTYYVDTTNAEGCRLYTEVKSGDMPKGAGKLSDVKIQQILLWIKQGAQDN